jgi:predicted phosphoribosyltransferase
MFMFLDRTEAGEHLALKLVEDPLIKEVPKNTLLVLSIPRGGVVVGAAVAKVLGCAHEVIAVKKIGFPGQAELAIGAIAEDGILVLNPQIADWFQPESNYLTQAVDRLKVQLKAFIQTFRQGRALDLRSKLVIIVDDGMATGETMKAAVVWVSAQQPQKVLVAVPVCSPQALREVAKLADKVICLAAPEKFLAVGQFYWDFDQLSDEEVAEYLARDRPIVGVGK